MRTLKTVIKTLVIAIIIVIAAGLLYTYSGAYNVGQDAPHNAATLWLLHTARERSIDNHDINVQVPQNLASDTLAKAGAKIYATHCSGCHLAPGKSSSPIHTALYPQPPVLKKWKHIPAQPVFWAIKHGIKFTAMPAWGKVLSDQQIWQVVAFLKQQPSLNAADYQGIVAPAPTPAASASAQAPASAASTAAPASAATSPEL